MLIAAIPFFQLGVYSLNMPFGLGVLPIDPWATLVCVGFVMGLEIARARAISLKLDVRDIVDGAVFTVLMGFFVAHVVTVVFYFPERLTENGALGGVMAIVRVWEGFSSTGGFIGAVIGAWIFYTWIRPVGAMRHADIICFGFPFGWFFGRMGCSVVHDHIGSLTTSPTGMMFPDHHVAHGLRHELGIYEMVYMIPVMALFFYLGRQDRVPGFFIGLFSIAYAPVRFFLDFLRNSDIESRQDLRYFDLTPAQYGMVVLFFAGIWLLWSRDYANFVPTPLESGGAKPSDPAPETENEPASEPEAETEVELEDEPEQTEET